MEVASAGRAHLHQARTPVTIDHVIPRRQRHNRKPLAVRAGKSAKRQHLIAVVEHLPRGIRRCDCYGGCWDGELPPCPVCDDNGIVPYRVRRGLGGRR